MSAAGSGPSSYIPLLSDIFGRKPGVAGWEDVILGDEQLKAIAANLKAFQKGDIQALGDLYQKYMLSQYAGAGLDLKSLISAGGANVAKMLGTAGEELAGMVPKDIQEYVTRLSASQNLGSGLMGGAMGAANWARNLGLTSLDMISKGAGLMGQAGNAARDWAGIAQGTTLPVSSFLITPQEQFAATTQNRLQSQRVEQQKLNIQAARDPIAGGLSDLVAYLTAAYLGGGRGASGGPSKVGASDYSAQTNVPAGGMGGSWAALTGQPYDVMGSGTGANTTIQYNAPPFQTDAMSGAAGYSPSSGAAPGPINDQYALPMASGYGYPQSNPAAMNIYAYNPYATPDTSGWYT
jgi:hypothetical protein